MDPVLCELTRVISGSSGYSEHLERADKGEDGPMSGRNRAGGGWKEAGVVLLRDGTVKRMRFSGRFPRLKSH